MRFLTAADPDQGSGWDVPGLREEYWAAIEAEGLRPEEEAHEWVDPVASPLHDDLDEIERTARRARAAIAEQDELLHRFLVGADREPDAWVGPDPTPDPTWVDSRERTAGMVRADRRMLAVRAAAADLGARLRLSDNQVRLRAHRAFMLMTRLPQVWGLSRNGLVPEQNMAVAAQFAATLPDDCPESWAVFDAALSDAAVTLAPGRFRLRARAARERAHSESLTQRHTRAAAERRVTFEPGLDGMTEICAIIRAVDADAIERGVDSRARHLRTVDGESRTLAQLRADVLVDLLTRAPDASDAGGSKVTATVNITIPALTLLGKSDDPATLAGYGPIPIETARELAADAPRWFRVLTDPLTGTVLDVERRAYRVPNGLRRWLGIRYPTCLFPGCIRSAEKCDVDHRKRWADGGHTSSSNLGPHCEQHHPVKDETLWKLSRDDTRGTLRWTTPTGPSFDLDPPPF